MPKPKTPRHGFPASEFAARHERARAAMHAAELDALVVTTPQNIRYFTGFETQFWESPTRPWYVIVPRDGGMIAVFPEVGKPAALETTPVKDIRSWPAPQPDDDGVSLMAKTLKEVKKKHGRIGWELGREMLVRAPRIDVDRMAKECGLEFADGSPVIWDLRIIKSEAEIARIGTACRIASEAYDDVPTLVQRSDTTRTAERKLRTRLLEKGADHVPFIATAIGAGGYPQIIAGPGDASMKEGDVLFFDVGCTYDGYFCDFDRNFAVGRISDAAKRAHEACWQATEAGIAAARPGVKFGAVFEAMDRIVKAAGTIGNNVGRMGHGLGMHLTEPPSFMAGASDVLAESMVVTIEPAIEYAPGKMLVHEENIVIRDGTAEILTKRAAREMPGIQL
jgi:Xaa-Pro aminopeptidase